MILYVIRHGIAEERAPAEDDGARRLTPRGRQRIRAGAAGLRAIGVRFDVLLTSPLVRAAETATIVAEVYGGQPVPRELPALAQGAPPAETVRALQPFLRHGHVGIVGHEPGLSEVVALLVTGSPDGMALSLKKGGVVALELRGRAPRTHAKLRWLLAPRHLRRIGRAVRKRLLPGV
ncbi:MAG: phosphohistidine phosphatase SixA [Deltaproteobacteria bacterium]|nr:MAG: phosphohistidine phosphatase SixA [Deltaproteobacteria bacterium]